MTRPAVGRMFLHYGSDSGGAAERSSTEIIELKLNMARKGKFESLNLAISVRSPRMYASA